MSLDQNKSSDYLYLEKLTFNQELRKSFLNFFVSNFRVVLLLIILLTGWGIYSFISLPLESQPEVKIPIAVVITAYPGASPTDIEELVTKKIETKLAGIKDVKDISSSSANSISSITVEFDAKANLDDSIRKLKDQVSSVKNELPAEANEPMVREISLDDTPVMTILLSGPGDGFELREYGDKLKSELEKVAGVREINISGGDEREWEVAYLPEKLQAYGLTVDQANGVIRATNLAIPGGIFEAGKYAYPVRSDSRFTKIEDLQKLPIFQVNNGTMITLGDIANVREIAIKKNLIARFSTGGKEPHQTVALSIVKKTGGSIVKTADAAKALVEEKVKTFPAGYYYDISNDMSEYIKTDFHGLFRDFLITLTLVFIVLFIIVGMKEALVAGLAIPLVFFATFGVMNYFGLTLNFLSMFSLILSLGLLVDDAIVVVSATKQYLRTGKFTPEEAVLLVLNDFKVVLTTTTMTTVWAFLPLLLSSGIMGEFIKSIPITVSVTLITSLIIALVINHPLAAVLERIRLTKKFFLTIDILLFLASALCLIGQAWYSYMFSAIFFVVALTMLRWYRLGGKAKTIANKALSDAEWESDDLIKEKLRNQSNHENASFADRLLHGLVNFQKVNILYERTLHSVITDKKWRRRILATVITLFVIACSLPFMGLVKYEFFPKSDFDYFYVNIKAPTGTRLSETDKVVTEVEQALLKYQEISNFSTIVGMAGTNGGSLSGGGGDSPTNQAAITIRLVDKKLRDKSYVVAEKMRPELEKIKGADVLVQTPTSGPPSGAEFEARVVGEDLQTLERIASELKVILTAIPGTINQGISLKNSPADYTFTLNPDKLALHNLNSAQVGSFLRLAISGSEITTVLKDGKEISIVARLADDKLPDLQALQNMTITNQRGETVFLREVATIELKPAVEKISRLNEKRLVSLTSSVDSSTNSVAVLQEFQKRTKDYKLPAGYAIEYGGQNETNQESVNSILLAMLVSALLIVSTLVVQFNSFKQAVIVLVTIPMALTGVFYGLAVTGISLSFPGLIGIVALFGIVVKNAIILIDKINLNIRSGIEFIAAIVDAGKSRLEAIVITSLCTIVGILPVTLSDETWTALGSAVIFGLMLSSFLTLFIIPILYATFVKPRRASQN